MTKRTKRFLITLCVIAGVIIVASVVLRAVFTKERLTAMIVPRIEARAGAQIRFDDIGIRFPFGFGVSIDGLEVSRVLPDGGKADLKAAKFNVNVSLMSLIRKKPEIKSVTLGGASLSLTGTAKGIDLEVGELDARLSMTPVDSMFMLDPNLTAGKITLITAATGQRKELPPLGFSGQVAVAADMSRAAVIGGKLDIAGIAAFQVEGDVTDLRGRREFTMNVKSSGLDAKRLVEVMKERGLLEMPEGQPAFVVESGTLDIEAKAAGMGSNPSDVTVSGRLDLEKLVLSMPGAPALTAGGPVDFTDSRISSKGLSLKTGKSDATVAFGMDLDKVEKKPTYVSFDIQAKLDMGELSSMAPAGAGAGEPVKMEGTLKAALKGGASPAVLKDLFPPKEGGTTPAKISAAWKGLELAGSFDLTSDELPGEKGPARISSLRARGSVGGGSFNMGGRPWKVRGEMKDVMPAMAELMMVGAKGKVPQTPGPVLDGLVNSPDMSIYVEGRAFDAAAFQAEAEKKKLSADKSSGGGGAPKEKTAVSPMFANPVTLLALKKTFISVKIDSIISRGAVLTALNAQGRISNGVLRADPVTVDYAGGKGSGKLVSDLRDPSRIRNDIDFDFNNIDAGRALSGFNSAGGLVSGKFGMKLAGSFTAAPDTDILRNLTATGSATSTAGTVDFTRFTAPLKAAGLNMSSIEKFDFHEWTEKFAIDKGRVSSDTWNIRSKNGDWDVAGSFGFDGTLDYKAALMITPKQQAGMKDLAKYAGIIDLFKDDKGNILLMLDIGGTAKEPKVRLDQSNAKANAGKKLIEGAKDKLKDFLK